MRPGDSLPPSTASPGRSYTEKLVPDHSINTISNQITQGSGGPGTEERFRVACRCRPGIVFPHHHWDLLPHTCPISGAWKWGQWFCDAEKRRAVERRANLSPGFSELRCPRRDQWSSGGPAESSELIRQVLLSESFWKPATDFHPALVASPRASARSEPRRRRDCI